MLLAIKSIGESTEAWRTVLDDLIRCGLRRSEFLFVDGAPGLDKTIAAVPDGVPVQRCTVISCVSYNLTDSIVLIPHGESQAEAVRGAVKMARRVRPTRCSIVRAPRPPRAAVPGVMMRARRSKAVKVFISTLHASLKVFVVFLVCSESGHVAPSIVAPYKHASVRFY